MVAKQPIFKAFWYFRRAKTGHHELKSRQKHLFWHSMWCKIIFGKSHFSESGPCRQGDSGWTLAGRPGGGGGGSRKGATTRRNVTQAGLPPFQWVPAPQSTSQSGLGGGGLAWGVLLSAAGGHCRPPHCTPATPPPQAFRKGEWSARCRSTCVRLPPPQGPGEPFVGGLRRPPGLPPGLGLRATTTQRGRRGAFGGHRAPQSS